MRRVCTLVASGRPMRCYATFVWLSGAVQTTGSLITGWWIEVGNNFAKEALSHGHRHPAAGVLGIAGCFRPPLRKDTAS